MWRTGGTASVPGGQARSCNGHNTRSCSSRCTSAAAADPPTNPGGTGRKRTPPQAHSPLGELAAALVPCARYQRRSIHYRDDRGTGNSALGPRQQNRGPHPGASSWATPPSWDPPPPRAGGTGRLPPETEQQPMHNTRHTLLHSHCGVTVWGGGGPRRPTHMMHSHGGAGALQDSPPPRVRHWVGGACWSVARSARTQVPLPLSCCHTLTDCEDTQTGHMHTTRTRAAR